MGLTAIRADLDPVLSAFADEVGTEGPVAVEGGRTRWEVGGELDAGTRLVRAPSGIVDHVPAEMIVRVRAGEPVASLAAALAEAGQRCALPERGGTVGGGIAVGENHLEVLGRGSLRASVLQVRYVSAEGRIVTGGGETVKNVSGFDLPRLLVGSLGTLGLVAEVVLRTNPIPPDRRWVRSADADPWSVQDRLLRPSAILWDATSTWVLVEGHRPDVDAQLGRLADLGTWVSADGPPPLPPHRWSVRPSDIRALAEDTERSFVAVVGVGTAFASDPQPTRPVPDGIRGLNLRAKAQFDPVGRLSPGRSAGW